MFGIDRKVILHLVELPVVEEALKVLAMELKDGAYTCSEDVDQAADPETGFNNIDAAILVGARDR